MNEQQHERLHIIALGIGILVIIFIIFTFIRHIPALQTALQTPLPQALKEPGLWFTLAEMLFYTAVLAAIYGLISLWLPGLRFILWAGTALVVIAGSLYLLAVVMYYQTKGMGPFIQQGGFMFLVSLVFPFLMRILVRRFKRSS